MSEVYAVTVNHGEEYSPCTEGLFSTREKAQFYLDYVRDQGSGMCRIQGPFVVDELVHHAREAIK